MQFIDKDVVTNIQNRTLALSAIYIFITKLTKYYLLVQ